MDTLNEIGLVFAFVAGIGAVIGYIVGWTVAVRGGTTGYFRELAHRCARDGMTRNQFASFVGIRCGLSFGFIACILCGIVWLVGWLVKR